MSYPQSFLGVENVIPTSKVAKGSAFVTPVENIRVYGLDFSTLGKAGLEYESDSLSLIGVHHVPDYGRASAETYLVNGTTWSSPRVRGPGRKCGHNYVSRGVVPSRFLRTFGQPYRPASRCASSSSVTSR